MRNFSLGLRELPAWFVRSVVLLAIAGALAMVLIGKAFATPRAQSGEECQLLADMALVSRALVLDEMKREQVDRIMGRVYSVDPGRGADFMRLITDAAYRAEGGAGDFAKLVLRECAARRGNLDAILGTDS